MLNGRAAGLVLALVSAAAFATSGSLAGSLIAIGWTPGAAVVARVLVAAVVLTVPAAVAMRGRWSLLRRGVPTMLMYGIVAVAVAQFAFFNAISHLSVGVALLLEYQGTVAVVAWLWLRHGRRPRPMVLAGEEAQPLPPLALSCAGLWVGGAVMVGVVGAGLVPFRTATAPVQLAGH